MWHMGWEERSYNKFLYSRRKSIYCFYDGCPLCGSVVPAVHFVLWYAALVARTKAEEAIILFCLTSNGFRCSFCSWQTSESRVNFVVLRQPGVQLLDPGEDGSTSNNSSSSSGGGSPVHHRRRLEQSHYRRKSNYQKVSLEITAKTLVTLVW